MSLDANAAPARDDYLALKRHLDAAMRVRGAIEWGGGYPAYPPEIEALMRYLGDSPWADRQYDPRETDELMERLPRLPLDKVRSVLTAMMRAERFSTGVWERLLEEGILARVVERANELTADEAAPDREA